MCVAANSHTLASILCLQACESSQAGKTAFDLAQNDEIRALLRAARPAAPVPIPPPPVFRFNAPFTPILFPSDVESLLSRLSLSSYGPALVDKFGFTLSNAHLLQEKDLTGLGMKPLQARALLHAVAPPPPAPPAPPPPTVAAELERCDSASIVRLLHSLGYLSANADTAVALRDELSAELVATSAPSLAAALKVAVAARLASFIALQAVPRLTAAEALLQWAGRFDAMWLELYAKYVPSSLSPDKSRSEKRVLIIGHGFELNSPEAVARQKGLLLERAGFKLHPVWASDPERPGYDFAKGVTSCLDALRSFKPHAVLCGSRGGVYLVELWRLMVAAGGELHGWCGAGVMLNVHPSCVLLPKDAPIVIAHGSSDTTFRRSRRELEELVATGGGGSLLYFSAGGGSPARLADGHDMASLLHGDCISRLVDAVTIDNANGALFVCPEFNLMRSWRAFLSPGRVAAEDALGFLPNQWVTRFWGGRDGRAAQKLFDVDAGTAEWRAVRDVFLSDPAASFYGAGSVVPWSQRARITHIQRVENDCQEGGAQTIVRGIDERLKRGGLSFTGGVHSRWLFHGTDPAVLDKVVHDPVHGFAALASTRCLWGVGSNFARDASFSDAPAYVSPDPDGSKRMLLSLVITGVSALGAKKMLRFSLGRPVDSLVDDLSSPEIFVVDKDSQVCPAYVIRYNA